MRPAGTFSILASADKVTKTQDQSENYANGEALAIIDIQRTALFYGGKGGGITVELFADASRGEKVTKLQTDTSEIEYSDNVLSSFNLLSIGFTPRFGITIGTASTEFQSKYSGSFEGYSFSSDYEYSGQTLITRVGTTLGSTASIGLFLEVATTDGENKSEGISSSDKSTSYVGGIGFASRSTSHHYELSIEIAPYINDTEENTDFATTPQRYMLTLEQKFSFAALGYSIRLYRNGFADNENLIYSNLVYSDFSKDRLEQKINFSLGKDRGSSLSGSITFSQTTAEEKDILTAGTEDKYQTKIEEYGVALKYAYSF